MLKLLPQEVAQLIRTGHIQGREDEGVRWVRRDLMPPKSFGEKAWEEALNTKRGGPC